MTATSSPFFFFIKWLMCIPRVIIHQKKNKKKSPDLPGRKLAFMIEKSLAEKLIACCACFESKLNFCLSLLASPYTIRQKKEKKKKMF